MISRLGRDYRQHFYGPHGRISRYPSTGSLQCNEPARGSGINCLEARGESTASESLWRTMQHSPRRVMDAKEAQDGLWQGVPFIRLLWCNGAGLRSCRVLPLSKDSKVREHQLQGLAEQVGYGVWRPPLDQPYQLQLCMHSFVVLAGRACSHLRRHVPPRVGRRTSTG